MTENYEDLINLPHHVSKKHPKMSMWNRAAQFAPFAAVSGHNHAIHNTEINHQDLYKNMQNEEE